jgi:hypothetical protein
MENKGLCISCVNDRGCSFPRIFPVLQCEEFSDYCPRVATITKKTAKDIEKSNKKGQLEETCVE